MTLINQETKLCDIILQETSTITVLDRFGISLGVGDARINDICQKHGIDVNFFTSILNTYINENYFPHFAFLISKTPSQNSNLVIMRQFFYEVKAELLQRIEDDRTRWFPAIALDEMKSLGKMPSPIMDGKDFNDPMEDKIDDLINMLVMHLKGEYDHNLGYAVISAIFSLKRDIKQNNRIRNRILMPISQALATSSKK